VITLDPNTPDYTDDDIVFGDEAGEDTSALGSEGLSFDLADGLWNVTVEAWRQYNGEEYKAAWGTASLTVTASGQNTVQITLNPSGIADADGAKGVFAWNLTLPDDADITAFCLGEPGAAGEAVPHTVTERETAGSLEKAAGMYGLKIELTRTSTGETAGIYETVHIYPGLVTEANYNFSAWNFAEQVLVAGTLSFTRAGPAGETVSYIVQAYSDEGCSSAIAGASAAIGSAAASGTEAFVLRISAARYAALASKTVYLKAGVSAFGYETVSQPVITVADLGLQGRAGVGLSAGIVMVYTITYNGNGHTGGTVPDDQPKTYGTELFLQNNSGALVKANDIFSYTFEGWNTAANGSGTTYGEGALLTADLSPAMGSVTLYAKWTGISSTVTLDPQNGGGTESVTAAYGSAMPTPITTPTRTGYAFGGYYTETEIQYYTAAGESARDSDFTTDVTLYARWTALTCTLTYSTADGCSVIPASETVTYDFSYTLAVPVKAGYTFGGWYTGAGAQLTGAGGASLEDWNSISDSMTVYAEWTVNTYTVTYDAEDGSVSPDTAEVTYDDYYILAIPVKAGYTFGGWYTGAGVQLTGASGASLEAWTTAASITVYARWGALITFNYNGVQVNGNSSVSKAVFSERDIPWPVKAQSGKVFLGWYDAADGENLKTSVDLLAGANQTFYAHWFDTNANLTDAWEYDSATGGMVGSYLYTGSAEEWTPPVDGIRAYTFEAWGGNGGANFGSTHAGGLGGYSKGTLNLDDEETLYFYTGAAAGAWNGGGNYGTLSGELVNPGGAGGGASSISLSSGAWNDEIVLARRILAAGGGGGADYGPGRNGGGLAGGSAAASGGTQTGAGSGNGVWGAGGQGGNGDTYTSGGGGGGGYYGGGGSPGETLGTGGGGGSGYVFGLTGCGDTTHHPALLLAFPAYQFSGGVTAANGEAGFAAKPAAAGSDGCIRVTYTPPAAPYGEYSITYNVNGGPSVSDVTYRTYELPYLLPVLQQAGRIFWGWCDNVELSGDPVWKISQGNTGNKTYYAKWSPASPGINVNMTVSCAGLGWFYDSVTKVITIQNNADVVLTGSTTQNRITIESGAAAIVTLQNTTVNLSGTGGGAFDLEYGAAVTLILAGTNVLTSGGGAAGIHVTVGRSLIIDSAASTNAGTDTSTHAANGTLSVTGGSAGGAGAAIGGSMSEAGGTITIAGGTVNAYGGQGSIGAWAGAAGIGGGGDLDTGTNDGRGHAGSILISGGVVHAEGSINGAGIGGGAYAANTTAVITISGGTVTASGGAYAAGIGGGCYGAAGNITISPEAAVSATGGARSIGAGFQGGD
jgi:uncharacterized repeat protein (TIGR02543 family)